MIRPAVHPEALAPILGGGGIAAGAPCPPPGPAAPRVVTAVGEVWFSVISITPSLEDLRSLDSVDARGLERLELGEPGGVHTELVHDPGEAGRRFAVESHPVVVSELGEEDLPSLEDVHRVLNQSI